MSTLVVTITVNPQDKSFNFFTNLDENNPQYLADSTLLNAAVQEVAKEVNQKVVGLLTHQLILADSQIKELTALVTSLKGTESEPVVTIDNTEGGKTNEAS